MPKESTGLLAQIETGAIDSTVPLVDTLRKCVALGGQAGSAELRDWARRELEGYTGRDDEDLPPYRTVPAFFALDGATLTSIVTQQPIALGQLPDAAQEHLKEQVDLYQGVAELQKMVDDVPVGGAIKLTLPGMGAIVRYMNHVSQGSGTYGQSITSIYWVLSPVSVVGVLDRIRTILTALVAELRAAGLEDGDVPTSEATSEAINVVLHGGERNNVTITTARSGGAGSATVGNKVSGNGRANTAVGSRTQARLSEGGPSSIPAWIRGPWGFLVGAATILGGYAALAAGADWWPF